MSEGGMAPPRTTFTSSALASRSANEGRRDGSRRPLVINKADLEGAEAARQEVELVLHLRRDEALKPPVLCTTADRDEGVDAVVVAIEAHLQTLQASGRLDELRLRQMKRQAMGLIGHSAQRVVIETLDPQLIDQLIDALRQRTCDPAGVASRVLFAAFGERDATPP